MNFVKKLLYFIAGMILLITIWQLLIIIGNYEEALFPPPRIVGQEIIRMVMDGTIFVHLQVSLGRFTAGYILAVIPAIVLGMLLGRMPRVWRIVDPIVQVLRPVSPVAWSPFIVLWFGIGDIPAIVIIFIAAFFPVLITTVTGVMKIDRDYLKIAENMEIKQPALMTKIILPATFPSIVSGLRLALGTAWIFLVAGEMVGAQSGLGYLIVDARNTLNLAGVFAGIIFIGLSGFILDRLITLLEVRVGRHWGTSS